MVILMKTASELWRYVSQKGLKPLPKTEVSTWADLAAALNSGSQVKLMQDVQKDDYLTVG